MGKSGRDMAGLLPRYGGALLALLWALATHGGFQEAPVVSLDLEERALGSIGGCLPGDPGCATSQTLVSSPEPREASLGEAGDKLAAAKEEQAKARAEAGVIEHQREDLTKEMGKLKGEDAKEINKAEDGENEVKTIKKEEQSEMAHEAKTGKTSAWAKKLGTKKQRAEKLVQDSEKALVEGKAPPKVQHAKLSAAQKLKVERSKQSTIKAMDKINEEEAEEKTAASEVEKPKLTDEQKEEKFQESLKKRRAAVEANIKATKQALLSSLLDGKGDPDAAHTELKKHLAAQKQLELNITREEKEHAEKCQKAHVARVAQEKQEKKKAELERLKVQQKEVADKKAAKAKESQQKAEIAQGELAEKAEIKAKKAEKENLQAQAQEKATEQKEKEVEKQAAMERGESEEQINKVQAKKEVQERTKDIEKLDQKEEETEQNLKSVEAQQQKAKDANNEALALSIDDKVDVIKKKLNKLATQKMKAEKKLANANHTAVTGVDRAAEKQKALIKAELDRVAAKNATKPTAAPTNTPSAPPTSAPSPKPKAQESKIEQQLEKAGLQDLAQDMKKNKQKISSIAVAAIEKVAPTPTANQANSSSTNSTNSNQDKEDEDNSDDTIDAQLIRQTSKDANVDSKSQKEKGTAAPEKKQKDKDKDEKSVDPASRLLSLIRQMMH